MDINKLKCLRAIAISVFLFLVIQLCYNSNGVRDTDIEQQVNADTLWWSRIEKGETMESVQKSAMLGSSNEKERVTLTRLGSSLDFDPTTCPPESMVATSKLRSTKPQHNDCPTLFIVGARKGGTTSLYNYISHHPEFEGILLNKRPGIGETFYFESKEYLKNSWSDYIAHFPPRDIMSGDASVGNLVQCTVPERLFTSCGTQSKVVMLFRDPMARLTSNVLFRRPPNNNLIRETSNALSTISSKHEFKSLMKEIKQDTVIKKWSSLLCLFVPAGNVVFEGLYYVHLLNWLCNFPPENILIINSEEFFANSSVILDQVVQFLGLKQLQWHEYEQITNKVYNEGNYSHTSKAHIMPAKMKQKLLEIYEPFNAVLLKLLEWPLHSVNWKHKLYNH